VRSTVSEEVADPDPQQQRQRESYPEYQLGVLREVHVMVGVLHLKVQPSEV